MNPIRPLRLRLASSLLVVSASLGHADAAENVALAAAMCSVSSS